MGEEQLERWARLVRLMRRIHPAGASLTFQQSLALAKTFEGLFNRFIESRAAIGSLEVRVGAEPLLGMIQNHPNGVREIRFKRAFAADTVLQIWRSADPLFDAVPLLFLALDEVTAEGVSRTQHYPNGQSLTLFVARESDGEYHIKLSFAAGEEAERDPHNSPAEWEIAAAASSAAGAAGAEKPKAKARAAAVAFAFLLVCQPFWMNRFVSAPRAGGQSVAAAADVAVAHDASGSAVLAPSSDGAGSDAAYPTEVGRTQSITGPAAAPPAGTVIKRGELARVVVVSSSETPGEPSASAGAALGAAMTAARTERQRLSDGAVVTAWDLQREIKMSEVKRVYVDEVRDARLDENLKSSIREGIRQALSKQRIEVLDERAEVRAADSVLTLRFEPDETSSGAVFGELRDGKGQYIWDSKAGCRTVADGDLAAALGDASQRLGMLMVAAIQQAQSNADAYQQGLAAQTAGR